jgi:hypothetical protein
MYEAIRIPNIDEILKEPKEAPRIDPIDENVSVLYGKPIRAFPEQDHESHIAVHIQFMSDPSLAGNPGAKTMQPILIAHIAEHVALLYRSRMQASIGVPLPNLPDIRDKEFQMEDIDPQMDMMISQRAAQVVQMAPKMQEIRALTNLGQQGQQNPLQYAQELAKLEAEALKFKTEADIAASQAKAQSDIQISQAKAQNETEINQAKAQSSIEMSQMKVQADLEAKITKLEAELQLEREKAIIESQGEVL